MRKIAQLFHYANHDAYIRVFAEVVYIAYLRSSMECPLISNRRDFLLHRPTVDASIVFCGTLEVDAPLPNGLWRFPE